MILSKLGNGIPTEYYIKIAIFKKKITTLKFKCTKKL